MGPFRSLFSVAVGALLAAGCTFMTGGGLDEGQGPADPGGGGERVPAPDGPSSPDEPGGEEPEPSDPAPALPDDAPPDDPQPDLPPPDGPPDDQPLPGCEPPCGSGEVCRDGACALASEHEEAVQLCVDLTNRYREAHGRAPVVRSADLERCATEGAEFDSGAWFPHAHFSRTGGCGGIADAENECPGWSGDPATVVRDCLAMMMAEGPGGGHYENILGSHTGVGCGIFVTARGAVWVVQDFR